MKAPELLEAKKHRILAAASRLLVRRGFQDIALDDVAKAAGVAKGTLFLYYKNKSDLFSAVFADLVERFGEEMDTIANSGLRGKPLLGALVRAILVYFEKNRDFLAPFGSGSFPAMSARDVGKLLDKFRGNQERAAKILRACRKDGLFKSRSGDYSYAALALFGLCRAALIEKILGQGTGPLADRTGEVVGFFLGGLGG